MQYRAAIFDLDGTLVDTLEDLAISVNEMLESYGFPTHPLDEYRYYLGNGSKKLIERTLPKEKAADEAFVIEAMKRYQAIYEHHRDHTGPFPGIQAMLDALKAKGIPMGVCTNKHQQAADEIIGGMFPAGTFTTVMGDRPGLPIKPDPKKVLMMAKEYGVKPKRSPTSAIRASTWTRPSTPASCRSVSSGASARRTSYSRTVPKSFSPSRRSSLIK